MVILGLFVNNSFSIDTGLMQSFPRSGFWSDNGKKGFFSLKNLYK
jgi:hypothetical protein